MPDDLFIKYKTGDTGARPTTAGEPVHLSPSITLSGGINATTAKIGVVNTINVQVDSKQTDPGQGKINVKVQVWVCDFNLGVGPAAALLSNSSNGASGFTDTVDTTVYAGAPGLAQVNWTPVPADLINKYDPNTGHVCIGANVYVEGTAPEGAIKSFGTLDPFGNQHHAQKNIAVVQVAAGGMKALPFRVINDQRDPMDYQVEVAELDPRQVFDPVQLEALATYQFVEVKVGPTITIPGGSTLETLEPGTQWELGRLGVGRLGLVVSPETEVETAQTRLVQAAEPFERQLLRAGAELYLSPAALQYDEPVPLRAAEDFGRLPTMIGGGEAGSRFRTRLDALDRTPFTLHVEGGDRPGEVRVFDATQTDEQGRVRGGARVISVTTPD